MEKVVREAVGAMRWKGSERSDGKKWKRWLQKVGEMERE